LTSDSSQLKQQAAKSLKWALIGDLLPKIMQPVVTIVLARILVPEDFGIIGIATLVIGLVRMIESMGLNQALIQTDEDIEEAADVVFWSNLSLSIILFIVLYYSAPLISRFFDEPRSTAVIQVMGIQLLISAFDDVQEALLQRDFQFRELVGRRLVPVSISAVISIAMALAGYGYWSLVVGTLIGTALGVVFLWRVSQWRPRFRYDLSVARLLIGFGGLVTLESLQGWALNYGDNLAAGYFLGVEALGFYTMAFTIAVVMLGFLILPVSRVAYSAFSRLKDQTEELGRAFVDMTQYLAVIVIPASLGVFLCAELIVEIILDDSWIAAIPAIQILAIMPGLSWIIALYPSLYRAIGRPDVMPKFHIATLLYIIPAYIIGGQFGLEGFSLARASVGFVFYVPHIWLSIKLLDLPKAYFWDCIRTPLFAGLFMSGLVYWVLSIKSLVVPGWVHLAGVSLLGMITYCLAVWLLDKSLFARMVNLARKMI